MRPLKGEGGPGFTLPVVLYWKEKPYQSKNWRDPFVKAIKMANRHTDTFTYKFTPPTPQH